MPGKAQVQKAVGGKADRDIAGKLSQPVRVVAMAIKPASSGR
jgi:hypothetical protein